MNRAEQNAEETIVSISLAWRTLRLDELTARANRAEALAAREGARLHAQGPEQTIGVFLPMIGVSTNLVTVATRWPGEPPAAEPPGIVGDGDIAGATTRVFDVLARGQKVCEAPGVYTFRWFVTQPQDVDEVTRSSAEAWPLSEADTAMRVVGFWRARVSRQPDTATILMIVYYPDLTAWDASRYWKPKPPGASQPNRHVWGEMFRKRRDLLLDSWVTIHRLAPPS